MFETWFPRHWTTLKKLIWLRATALGNAIKTVTGAIVTFVTSKAAPLINLTATLSPVQNLHGYDSPWPPGGGVNRYDATANPIEQGSIQSGNGGNTPSNDRIRTNGYIPVTPSTEYYVTFSGTATKYYPHYYDSNKVHTTSESAWKDKNSTFTVPSGSAYVRFAFRNASDNAIVPSDISDIAVNNPATVTTFSPYSNECPISGHTGATVVRTGNNLFDKDSADNATNKWLNTSNGELRNSASGYDTSGFIPIVGGETYTASGFSTTGTTEVCFYNSSKGFISGFGSTNHTFTVPDNAAYLRFDYKHDDLSSMQLEKGSIASPYEPYSGTTYPITFPDGQTVYSGTLSVNEDGSGQIVATKKYALLNDPDEWIEVSLSTGNFRYSDSFSDRKLYNNSYTGLNCTYMQVDTNHPQNTARWASSSSYTFALATNDIPSLTLDDVKADATAGNIAILYDLATPITIPLTAEQVGQITTLKGTNVVWVDDSDEISVTYRE